MNWKFIIRYSLFGVLCAWPFLGHADNKIDICYEAFDPPSPVPGLRIVHSQRPSLDGADMIAIQGLERGLQITKTAVEEVLITDNRTTGGDLYARKITIYTPPRGSYIRHSNYDAQHGVLTLHLQTPAKHWLSRIQNQLISIRLNEEIPAIGELIKQKAGDLLYLAGRGTFNPPAPDFAIVRRIKKALSLDFQADLLGYRKTDDGITAYFVRPEPINIRDATSIVEIEQSLASQIKHLYVAKFSLAAPDSVQYAKTKLSDVIETNFVMISPTSEREFFVLGRLPTKVDQYGRFLYEPEYQLLNVRINAEWNTAKLPH